MNQIKYKCFEKQFYGIVTGNEDFYTQNLFFLKNTFSSKQGNRKTFYSTIAKKFFSTIFLPTQTCLIVLFDNNLQRL